MSDTVSTDEIRGQRLENMRKLEELGYPAFGGRYERTGRLGEIREAFEEGREVSVAGRLVASGAPRLHDGATPSLTSLPEPTSKSFSALRSRPARALEHSISWRSVPTCRPAPAIPAL